MTSSNAVNLFQILLFSVLITSVFSISYDESLHNKSCPCGRTQFTFSPDNFRFIGFHRSVCSKTNVVEHHMGGDFDSFKSQSYSRLSFQFWCSMSVKLSFCNTLDKTNISCNHVDRKDRILLEIEYNKPYSTPFLQLYNYEPEIRREHLMHISGFFSHLQFFCFHGDFGMNVVKPFDKLFSEYEYIEHFTRLYRNRLGEFRAPLSDHEYTTTVNLISHLMLKVPQLRYLLQPPRTHKYDYDLPPLNSTVTKREAVQLDYMDETTESSEYADPIETNATTVDPSAYSCGEEEGSWMSENWWIIAVLLVVVIVGMIIGFCVCGQKAKSAIAEAKKKREEIEKEIKAIKNQTVVDPLNSNFVILQPSGSMNNFQVVSREQVAVSPSADGTMSAEQGYDPASYFRVPGT